MMPIHPTIIFSQPRLLTELMPLGNNMLPPGTCMGMQNWIHHRDYSILIYVSSRSMA